MCFSAIITNIYIHFRQLLKLTLCLIRFCALLSVSFKVCLQMMLFKMGELVDQETWSSMLDLKTLQLEILFFLLAVVCLMPWLFFCVSFL